MLRKLERSFTPNKKLDHPSEVGCNLIAVGALQSFTQVFTPEAGGSSSAPTPETAGSFHHIRYCKVRDGTHRARPGSQQAGSGWRRGGMFVPEGSGDCCVLFKKRRIHHGSAGPGELTFSSAGPMNLRVIGA